MESTPRPPSLEPHLSSMPEPNGQTTSTPSEINNNADHAGLSVPQKPSQTDGLLPPKERSTLSSPQKIWSPATQATTVAVVDTWKTHGNTSKTPVLSQTHASHTLLVTDLKLHAPQSALMDQPGKNTSANLDQSLTHNQLTKLRPKSTTTVQLKVPSQSTKTSTATPQVSTNTSPVVSSVVTPSSSSVGELKTEKTTGSPPTPGDQDGE